MTVAPVRGRVTATAGRVRAALLTRGPRGFPLCRWCHRECPTARHTFCSPGCVHEHRMRSDPKYVREQVFARDRGVCAVCRMDTEAIRAALRKLRGKTRTSAMERLRLPAHRLRSSFWDADHIRPVAEGGGECGLDGYQTLCCACHARKTAVQAANAASARRAQTPR